MDKTRGTVLNYSHDHILLTVWGKSLKSVVFGNSCPIRVCATKFSNFWVRIPSKGNKEPCSYGAMLHIKSKH